MFAKKHHTGTKLGKEQEFKENLGGVMRVKLSAHKTIFVISGKREKKSEIYCYLLQFILSTVTSKLTVKQRNIVTFQIFKAVHLYPL